MHGPGPGDAPAAGTIRTGPRVGVTQAADYPWRFWIDGDRTVSAYKRAVPRPRPGTQTVTTPARRRWHDSAVTDIIDELTWRGLIAQSTDLDELRKALDAGVVTVYCGFDPTAPGLHIGNLVQLLTLRRFQLAGHRPIGAGRRGDRPDRRPERQVGRARAQPARDRGQVGGADPGRGGALPGLR